jgi:hypothetical protein
VLVGAAAVAGYTMAGWPGLSVVAVATAAIAMVVLRILLPQLTPDRRRRPSRSRTARTLSGYSHRRFVVRTATTSLAFYNSELRPVLEHLLAARLAERHNVNLYQDPEAARGLLCRNPRDADLWAWIDPATRPTRNPRGRDRRASVVSPGARWRASSTDWSKLCDYPPRGRPPGTEPRRRARPSWTSSSGRSSAAAGPWSWC